MHSVVESVQAYKVAGQTSTGALREDRVRPEAPGRRAAEEVLSACTVRPELQIRVNSGDGPAPRRAYANTGIFVSLSLLVCFPLSV